MKHTRPILSAAVGACALFSAVTATAGGGYAYEVTITNLTRGQTFTPILVASHKRGVRLFEAGQPASDALAAMAEGGDTGPLEMQLEDSGRLVDTGSSGGLLGPGETVTVHVDAGHGAREISLAGMLIPTNDGFMALNGARAPRGHRTLTYWVPAYDAGTEPNDELCVSIPGPVCGGEGGSPGADGEGYVHIHAGMHGIGDLAPADYDWRNPVAKVTIRRARAADD